jgi:hypothetical protein
MRKHGNPCGFCNAGNIPDAASIVVPSTVGKSREYRKKARQAKHAREVKWEAQIANGETEEQKIKREKSQLMFKEREETQIKEAKEEAENYIKTVLEKAKSDQVCNKCNKCELNGCYECVFPCPCCSKLYCATCHYIDCGDCQGQLCCQDCTMHTHLGKCHHPLCEMPAHDINLAFCRDCRGKFDAALCCHHSDIKLNLRCGSCSNPKEPRKGKEVKPKVQTRRKPMPIGFRKRFTSKIPDKTPVMLAKEEAEKKRVDSLLEDAIREDALNNEIDTDVRVPSSCDEESSDSEVDVEEIDTLNKESKVPVALSAEQLKIQKIKDQALARKVAREAAKLLEENRSLDQNVVNDNCDTEKEDNEEDEVKKEGSDNEDEVAMPPLEDNYQESVKNEVHEQVKKKPISSLERRCKFANLQARSRPIKRTDNTNQKRLPNGLTMEQMENRIMQQQLEKQMMAEMALSGKPPNIVNDGEEKEHIHIEENMKTVHV